MPIMPLMPHRNKKGFTLVELLLVIFLVALLATIALSSYTDSTRTLNFLGGYKQMMSSLRTARSYAITNKQVGGEIPERYGVCVSSDALVIFADTGDKPLLFDPQTTSNLAGCVSSTELTAKKHDEIIGSYDFTARGYKITAYKDADKTVPITLGLAPTSPMLIFYERGGRDVTFVKSDSPMTIDDRFLYLEFTNSTENLTKCATIYLLSGLAEESTCD